MSKGCRGRRRGDRAGQAGWGDGGCCCGGSAGGAEGRKGGEQGLQGQAQGEKGVTGRAGRWELLLWRVGIGGKGEW